MKLNEKFFEIIYNIVIQQNIVLLKTIAEREKIPYYELYNLFIKNHRHHFSSFIAASP
jgi:hypothetical protein